MEHRSLLLLALLLSSRAAAFAAPASLIDVQASGHGEPAVMFIPGLATPGTIWDDTVKQLEAEHACYTVSLAGFGGMAPVKTDHFLNDATDAIIAYAREHRLEHIVLVGHSLGGVVGMQITLKAPELISRLVLVDSLPFFAGLVAPGVDNAAAAKPIADSFSHTLAAQNAEQFAKGQREFIGSMVSAPDRAAAVAAMTGKSDPATVGQAMGELLSDDQRAGLGAIKCPVLVMGALAGPISQGMPRPTVEGLYRKQFAACSQARFEWFEKARHFIMVDDPAGFVAVLKKELATS